jgi:pyruvate/2-oxoglutarate dehydrogenase complex dihydrolipoamide acyltransferase (E2) component
MPLPEFRLPDLGEGVTEGEVVEWRVHPGDRVERDQVLCVVATDKATVELPSPFSGVVGEVLVPEGRALRVGEPLLRLAGPAGPTPAPETGAHAEPSTTPALRREFRLPDLGEGVAEGEVVEWRVRPGDRVERDQILCVVATDKATVELPSPFSGVVGEVLVPAGQKVTVGEALVSIEALDRGLPAPAAAPPERAARITGETVPEATARRVLALPAVRRAARDRGVDLNQVVGSGPGGRVRMADLGTSGRRERLRGTRRVMAERMAEAHRHVPQVTVALDCDMAAVERFAAEADAGGPTPLGLVCLAARAEVERLPIFNSSFDDVALELVYHPELHLGIAVQTEDGLKVATARAAGRLTSTELQAEIQRLVAGARAGTLSPAELSGATFTISSGGRLGGLLATPLVNWPNVATLGIHEIQDRPVVRQGQVVVGRCAVLTLSFDHRVIDGMTASSFLYGVVARLADPSGLLDGGEER